MSELAKKDCVPCRGGVPPLSGDRIVEPLGQLDGWKVELEHHLSKTYTFPDFAEALAFVNRVGAIAERSDRRSCGWPQVENVRLVALLCSSGQSVAKRITEPRLGCRFPHLFLRQLADMRPSHS